MKLLNLPEPTYENQLKRARELLAKRGLSALMNPHGHTGKMCRCKDCFCCAAWQVAQENASASLRKWGDSEVVVRNGKVIR